MQQPRRLRAVTRELSYPDRRGARLSDPPLDDLTPMRSYLRPSTFEPAPPRVLPEPPDGSVLRFTKGRRYTYVAVRRGDHWGNRLDFRLAANHRSDEVA
jgi:hypothetical protein